VCALCALSAIRGGSEGSRGFGLLIQVAPASNGCPLPMLALCRNVRIKRTKSEKRAKPAIDGSIVRKNMRDQGGEDLRWRRWYVLYRAPLPDLTRC
jgi:hypothetical protein